MYLLAYVVITHLDRDHISILPDLIKKYTPLPVVAIKENTQVRPGNIYVIPPKKNIVIKNGILNLVKQAEPHYKNFPINFFFHSLAEERGQNAIAIILSGSGSDGTLGLRDIKEYGGLTIVQDPSTASFDSMPRNAISTGLVDYIMPAEDIPLQLDKYLNYERRVEDKVSPALQQILIMLRTHTGHDFSHYKINTIGRRIEKQMHSHHIKNHTEYVRFLRTNTNELDNLFKDLLIGVTRFFRDAEAFAVLKTKLAALLMKKNPKDYGFRVWIPACSTGEEAYSIAIILSECMSEIKKYFTIQIFATDIDLSALEIARRGIYPETISVDVSPDRLKRFFTKEKDHYKIKKEIRSMAIFGGQNIIKDPPFTKLDLISCRNLLIYLNTHLQKKILPLFHCSLKPKGILFLGTSEATAGFTDHFQLIAKKWKIFERKGDVSSSHALLGFDNMSHINDYMPLPPIEQKNMDDKLDFNQAIETYLLDHYILPCIVINNKGDILFSHSSAGDYLRTSEKKNNVNVSDSMYPEIKMALIPAIRRIQLSKKAITYNNIKVKISSKISLINLHVTPITHVAALRGLILVSFEDAMVNKEKKAIRSKASLKMTNVKLGEVLQELQYTKENLQATIEELEAGNEELQSSNEELQSTNEEIETSKEELQSLNEELIIVNTELQSMIDKLATANDDMSNLFNSTEIAAFFLDNELRIKRFTPKAQEFIHLIQADIGRSFSHFSSTIKCEKLVENAKEVLKTLHQKNYEVESKDNRWYHIRILPYRTLGNLIDGVVITLSDITQFKEYENKLSELNNVLQEALTYTENIVDTVREPLLVLSDDLKIISANRSFYNTFKINESETIGKYIYDLNDKQWDIPQLRKYLKKVNVKNQMLENFLLEHDFPKVGYKRFMLNIRKIDNLKSKTNLILLAMGHCDAEKTI